MGSTAPSQIFRILIENLESEKTGSQKSIVIARKSILSPG